MNSVVHETDLADSRIPSDKPALARNAVTSGGGRFSALPRTAHCPHCLNPKTRKGRSNTHGLKEINQLAQHGFANTPRVPPPEASAKDKENKTKQSEQQGRAVGDKCIERAAWRVKTRKAPRTGRRRRTLRNTPQ